MINSAKIHSTVYDQSAQQWVVKFQTPTGHHTAVSKHLVQATGIGSQKPYLPPMTDSHLYKGINLHSAQYRNAEQLRVKGAKVSRFPSSPEARLFKEDLLSVLVLLTISPSLSSSSAQPTRHSTCSRTATVPGSR